LMAAVYRGDIRAIMDPVYWNKTDGKALEKLRAWTIPQVKEFINFEELEADFRQNRLRQGAGRFRLSPKKPGAQP